MPLNHRLATATLFAVLLFGASACNTMQGMGEDIESGGESLQHGAEDTQDEL
ncbi:entericidin A/B family lipoprotein [Aquibaculum sediminis]|uniref:entericidin A/B family lipoprotein n=1 Tax=Aquibaculum sediminis TaxID=3231907 RepID=UPI0034531AEF